jgi:hypothetical protein
LRPTARITAPGIRQDDRVNVGTPRAEWYASSHSLGSGRLGEWYTSRVHVAPQQYAIRWMPSGIFRASVDAAHASTEFRCFSRMSGTPPAYIPDGRLRNLSRPSVGYRSRSALRAGRHVAGGACRPDHPHPRRSRVSTSTAPAGEVGSACGPLRCSTPLRGRGALAAPNLWRCAARARAGGPPC